MNLSNRDRLFKVLNNLFSHPKLIPKYVRHNLLGKKLPMDLQMPWWSYTAIDYVDSIVTGKRIFEYGTGGSTIRFAKHAKNIVSVEDNSEWRALMESKLKSLNINNVKITYRPFDFSSSEDFEASDYLKQVDSDEFDIIIIDGQDHSFRERIKCFRYVEPRMKKGQFIIVDDYWRYEELSGSHKARELKVFQSVGPCRFGVTSTAVFSY